MLKWKGRQNKQGNKKRWGRIGCRRDELQDRDEKEVDGVGHAESDDMNELMCN